MTKTTLRAAVLAVAAPALITGTMIAAHPAGAAPAQPVAKATPAQAATLATTLGDTRTAGTYKAADGSTVVNVTDQAAADQVRAAGATPRLVEHSMAALNTATAGLNTQARIPGTAWSTDPVTNKVVVKVDSTVSQADQAALRSAAGKYGDSVTITAAKGTYALRVAGGEAIYGGGYRCSLGFNVTDGYSDYFITAGHCGVDVGTWYSDSGESDLQGDTQDAVFPGSDYALVAYSGSSDDPQGTVLGSRDITGAANATVGESVTRSGSTSGTHSGTVLGLNATVNYGGGDTVSGLIDTDVCAEPGDSGGSLYDGSTALGLTSGGSGDCTSGGETFFQPITEALSAYGMQIV